MTKPVYIEKMTNNKKNKAMKKNKKEGFRNYATGYSSSFGGDYLLLDE